MRGLGTGRFSSRQALEQQRHRREVDELVPGRRRPPAARPACPRIRQMIADSTSASSGDTTSSRSSSVLDGAMCSSGISSRLAGSRYWTRLWWDSSVSSSMRMPVSRRTSTAAQAQNPRCSSRVRSRRLPVPGSSAQIRPACCVFVTGLRSVWPAAVNNSPAAASRAACSRSAAGGALSADPGGRAGRTGSRSRVRWSIRDLRCDVPSCGRLLVADRAGRCPRCPPGRVLIAHWAISR